MKRIKPGIVPTLVAAYLLPLLGWSLLVFGELPSGRRPFYLGFGWMLMGLGGLFLAVRFSKEESIAPQKPGELFIEEWKKERELWDKEREETKDKISAFMKEKEEADEKIAFLETELSRLRQSNSDSSRSREIQIQELKKLVSEHRQQVDDKQTLLNKLQAKVSDLTFEIKTLVELHSSELKNLPLPEENKSVTYPRESGIRILMKCLEKAKAHTGSSSFHPGISQMKEKLLINYPLDQRRLFETFDEETGGIVFCFSPKEGKILFVNEQVISRLHCEKDEFKCEFAKWIEGAEETWRQGVQILTKTGLSEFHLPLRFPNGKELLFTCYLGLISSGLFKDHVLGVLT